MRIVYYFEQLETPMFQWQTDNIVNELAHFNIEVEIFNPLNFSSVEEANSKLLEQLDSKGYDLFMTCHNESLLYIDTLMRVKSKGIPTLLICFDNLLIPYEHRNICSLFDLVWLTSEENEELFKKWGAKTIFMPYAANPFFYRYNKVEERETICFIGTPYGSRANTINALLRAEISVSLYGKSNLSGKQKHNITNGYFNTIKTDLKFPIGRKLILAAVKQRVSRKAILDSNSEYIIREGFAENMSTVYSQHALSLSTTTARNTGVLKHPVPVVNLRSFEIPMSGGIQFCEYNKELSLYFQDSKEIVFYNNEEDMIDKAKFYLADRNYNVRNEIRIKARQRAENEHTWMCRFRNVFRRLNIDC